MFGYEVPRTVFIKDGAIGLTYWMAVVGCGIALLVQIFAITKGVRLCLCARAYRSSAARGFSPPEPPRPALLYFAALQNGHGGRRGARAAARAAPRVDVSEPIH